MAHLEVGWNILHSADLLWKALVPVMLGLLLVLG